MEDSIQVPIGGWPVQGRRTTAEPDRIVVRISAQRYNEPADYDRLAEALVNGIGRRARPVVTGGHPPAAAPPLFTVG